MDEVTPASAPASVSLGSPAVPAPAPALALAPVPTPRVRAPKKKVAPRAVYKTSSTTPDPLGITSDDETIIMRLNVCTRDMNTQSSVNKQVEPPDAYNAVDALSLVGNQLEDVGQGLLLGAMDNTCVGAGVGARTLSEAEVECGHGHGHGHGNSIKANAESVSCPAKCAHSHGHGHGGTTATPATSVAAMAPGMRVVQLLAEFDHKSRNSEWPSVTSVSCYWCCHTFACAPVGLPLRRSGDVFHVMGCFCSLECAAAYNFGMPRVSVDRALERFMLINSLASKLGVGGGAIKPAPDRLSLTMFGGPLCIEEFRNYRSTRRHVIINQPPMLTLMQQVEEVDERDMKSAYSYIPLDIARVEKFQEKVRLRRTRPLVDPKNTLDQCMKLRYGPDVKSASAV